MATSDIRWIQRLENFRRALSELEEQGLIQAFEFTHELSWLLIRDFLVDQGVAGISGSRESVWMAMIRSRNLTSHTYNPAVAREIAALIVDRYGPVFQQLADSMQQRVDER